MLTLQSPTNHLSSSSKPDLLSQHISPSFRQKRIPSAHNNYSYSSNHNLKITKTQSPSKYSQKLKRRKSQYINSSSSYLQTNTIKEIVPQRNNSIKETIPQKKKSSKSISTPITQMTNSNPHLIISSNNPSTPIANPSYPTNIIQQMNCLKNEYKQLKSAYQELIQEKINNSQKISALKEQNIKLESQLQLLLTSKGNMGQQNTPNGINSIMSPKSLFSHRNISTDAKQIQQLRADNMKLKEKNQFYELQLDRIKKQCYKLLQAEKFKSKKLQQLLRQKQEQMKDFRGSMLITVNQDINSSSVENQYSSFNIGLGNLGANLPGTGGPSHYNNETPSNKNLIMSSKQAQANSTPRMNKLLSNPPTYLPNIHIADESLFISQDKTLQNHSQFISISLTSVMSDSICKTGQNQDAQKQNKNNCDNGDKREALVQIDLINKHQFQSSETVMNCYKDREVSKTNNNPKLSSRVPHPETQAQKQSNSNPAKQANPTKKLRKEIHQRLELNLNHFEHKKESFLNIKTPINHNKTNKHKNSKSKKKQEDKENNLNYYHHAKDISQINCPSNRNMKKKEKVGGLGHK